MEANLVEVRGGVWQLHPPGDGLEEAPQDREMVLPRRVGHAAPVVQVHHVRLDLVGTNICIGYVHGVIAAEASGDPTLEELQLLAVVVYGPNAPAARALGGEEEVNGVPEPRAAIRIGRKTFRVHGPLARRFVRHGFRPPSESLA